MNPKVTIIMRTKNSADIVHQALASMFAQDFKDFELLVVDSGSTDETLDMVAAYPHRLQQIRPEDYFPGRVLNQGAAAAAGEILVFWNSDVVALDPHALGRLVAAFDREELVAAFARQLPRPEAHVWVRRDYRRSFPERGPAPPWISLSLPLAAMRKRIWEQRPFYTDAWASEDSEWGHWARRAGYEVAYVADARVMHSHNYTLRQLYGRMFVEGEADAFIHGGKASLLGHVRGYVGAVLGDCAAEWKEGRLRDMPLAFARRAVFQWAHLKGWKHGAQRREEGNFDAEFGQRVVLARHESTEKAEKARQ
ncbi:MAG: glycosyltransferase family 2 protein [Myxococcota bacterium]|jgi:rhamnosyltransferase|nr:glycosyltransferase family 2 protein [Myxococcota bacterium]